MKEKAKTIGKVHIKDLDKLQNWLNSEEGKLYIDNNWSKARNEQFSNNWQDGVNIGFYELQNKIPYYSKAEAFYRSICDAYDQEGCVKSKIEELADLQEYYTLYNQSFDLMYDGGSYAVFCSQNKDAWLFPVEFLSIEKFKDYDSIPINELKSIAGPKGAAGLIPHGTDISINTVSSQINDKEKAIKEAEDGIRNLENEKKAELEKLRMEIEAAYKDRFAILEKKKEELEEMKKELEGQIFLLDTEIYAIRSYNGETIEFTKITEGKKVDNEVPFVLYQKIRYLDVELAKHLAVYDFSGEDSEMKYFEEILKYRQDIREMLLPTEKCCTLFRISESGESYIRSDKIANVLEACDKYHGHTLGILIRNGEETYIAWTDENRISIANGNAFMGGENKTERIDEISEASTSKEEIASRYFLYATLQGVIDKTDMVGIPKNTSILSPSPYIVLSMADGWLEDNRFGYFEDIVKRTSLPMKKGDMVLTTTKITRDDIYSGCSSFGGRSTVNEPFINDRGRGDKNRTHNASLKNCTVYPINCVDRLDHYEVTELRHPLEVEEVKHKITENSYSFTYNTKPSGDEPVVKTKTITAENYKLGLVNIKGREVEDFMAEYNSDNERISRNYYGTEQIEHNFKEITGFIPEYVSTKHISTEFEYFISAPKSGVWWSDNDTTSRANMQIYEDECLNLTFLNSVWVLYAIQNQKVGRWKIGNKTVDYATSVKYLNKALEYLREREKEEAALISKYMKLPDEWQVALSEWKMKNDIHKLTDTRAKRFAKEYPAV